MNFKIINNDATLIESRDIRTMLKLGSEMAFKNDNSYKVQSKKLDVFEIKVGNPFVTSSGNDAMLYRNVNVLFNLDKKNID